MISDVWRHTSITQRYHRIILFHNIARSPNSQKWKCLIVWVQVFRNLPCYAIFIHPLVSFHRILIPCNSVPFHSIPLSSFHVLSCRFISHPFLLVFVHLDYISLPSVSTLRLCLLIVWVFEALSVKKHNVLFAGGPLGCTLVLLPGATNVGSYPK